MIRSIFVLTVILLSWSCGAAAAQEALPLAVSRPIGARVSAQVTVEIRDGETHIRGEVGASHAEIAVRGVTSRAQVESLNTSTGRVLVVRASGPNEVAAVFVAVGSTIRLAWSGRLDWMGDPGERWADALELTDRTGDGLPDVVVGVVREGLSRCGGEPALLSPRALTRTGTLRSVEIRRGLPREGITIIEATSTGPSTEPLLRALRFTGATSSNGTSDPLFSSPPRALSDGDVATVWGEGRGGDGSGEMIVGRWESSQPIESLRFRSGPGVALPAEISLVLGERTEVVRFAPGADDVWLHFAEPVHASCVAVVIDRGAAAPAVTGFGEISAYTRYDGDAGLASMVEELVAESEGAADLVDWLARLGEPACVALDGAWDRLSALGHLWAMRVGASVRAPVGDALLARGARDESAEVREMALAALLNRGAFDALAELAVGHSSGADDAALAIAGAEHPVVAEPQVLWQALEGPGRDRVALRLAAGRLAGLQPDTEGLRALSPSGLAALAVGLVDDRLGTSGRPERQRMSLEVATAALGASDFVDRYRLATALARATGEPGSPSYVWLSSQAQEAEEWMQRDAALGALGALVTPEVLAHALGDPYPRVRLRALELAAGLGEASALEAALSDPWPQVRLAALRAIHDEPHALAALGDSVALVRVGALEILTELGSRDAWPLVQERFADRDEWPEVIQAGLAYVLRLCIADAALPLAQIVRRGARDGAWAPDVELAIDALGVAFRLGGDAARRAREAASSGASVVEFEAVLSREAGFAHCE